MKIWRTMAILLSFLTLVGFTGCNPFAGEKEAEVTQQEVRVVRGDLTLSVSGSGRIEVAKETKLTFGTGGRIEKLAVKASDGVRKGAILAKLDTTALELAVTQAQLSLTEAQASVTQAEASITQARVGVTQAQLSLEVAKFNLDRMEDVAEAKDAVSDAELEVKVAQARLKEALQQADDYGIRYWMNEVFLTQAKLAEAQRDLVELLAEPDYAGLIVDDLVIKKLQVELAKQTLEQARKVAEMTKQTVEVAKRTVEVAKQSLEQARKRLSEAVITAPFDGIVARVSADEGETVSTTTTIIYLIDLSSMELKISVDEIDIPSVRLKQRATVSVDALPHLNLEGKVMAIGLLSKVESGIVSYEVTIGLDVPEDAGLKVGMSATADIVTDERRGVLLIPARAVIPDRRDSTIVKVMVDGQVQEKAVVTGVSDGIQTEIVDGLHEGEVVVLETGAKPRETGVGFFFRD